MGDKENKKVTYESVREKPWKDLEDNDYIYTKGDIYPREGLKPTKERIKELSTKNNKLKEILIKKVEIENNPTTTNTKE